MKYFFSTFLFLFLGLCTNLSAESITYRIVEYNKDTQRFTLAPCGLKPEDSFAEFENEFGATYGNRYNQIPRNKQGTLWLYGWEGCKIESLTLSMCSNNVAGEASLQILFDDEVQYKTTTESFDSEAWFGRWVSKDLGIYVDIEKQLPEPIIVPEEKELGIRIKGGTHEGSVYLNAITIEYTPDEGMETESPLGWIYEKIEKKSTIEDGDVVVIYREGSAAGDIDGMEKSSYLDAIAIKSTTSIDDPDICLFTLNKTEDAHWTFTNQYGEVLGAAGAQNLVWNDGVQTWDITNGYDGVTIASTNSKYGTLRYNAPSESYARFWNYTSTSLKLPYLYRQARQQQQVVSTELQLSATHRTVALGSQDTLVLRYQLKPAAVTNQRVRWESSNESVAKVRSGIVEILALGETTITATSLDGGSQSTCTIEVVEPSALSTLSSNEDETATYWDLAGRKANAHAQKNVLLIKKSDNR